MIGERMLRRSMRVPSDVAIWPVDSRLPTNRLSAIHCISSAFSRTGLPHQVSNSRNRSASVSTLANTMSGCFSDAASKVGAKARQGPHQAAQKSIATGLVDCMTSASKF